MDKIWSLTSRLTVIDNPQVSVLWMRLLANHVRVKLAASFWRCLRDQSLLSPTSFFSLFFPQSPDLALRHSSMVVVTFVGITLQISRFSHPWPNTFRHHVACSWLSSVSSNARIGSSNLEVRPDLEPWLQATMAHSAMEEGR